MLAQATADEVRGFVEPITNPVAVLEPHLPSRKMRFFVVNSQAGLASGYGVDALEGCFLDEVLPKEVAQQITDLGFECIKNGTSQIYEDAGALPSGVRSWRGSIFPLVDPKTGTITRLLLSITDYSQDTKPLSRYNRFFELSQDMIAVADTNGYFLELNDSWERALGWPRETLQEHPFVHWLHPDDVERTLKEAERVAQGIKAINFENRYRHRDGSYRWLQWHADVTDDGLLFCVARDITDAKTHSEAMRAQTTMLEQAEHFARFGHWRYDLTTQKLTTSRQIYRIFGYNPYKISTKDVNSRVLLESYTDEDRTRLQKTFESAMQEQRGFSFEAPITLPDGTTRYTTMYAHPEQNGKGDMVAMFGVIQDVTERKEAERALEKQRRFTEQILDALPINVFVKDGAGRFRFINRASSDTFGWDKSDIAGKDDFALVSPEAAERFRTFDDRVRELGTAVVQEREIAEKQWILAGKMPIEQLDNDDQNDKSWILGYSFDISERKEAELQLAAQRNFIRRILDNDPNLIYLKDAEGRFVMANRAVGELFGVDPATLVGKSSYEMIHREDEAESQQETEQAVINTGATIQIEETVTLSDGTVKTFETTKMPFYRPNGENHVLAIAVDVSERKSYEESLYEAKNAAEAATKAKSAFLATMSHEIRTPLNAVIGMTGLLLDTELNAEQRGYTTAAKNAGEHLLQLINDILDISKLDAGKVTLEEHPFSLKQELETVADMARLTATRKGLDLTTSIDPDLTSFSVRGDSARLRQVLLNLVGNAVKFTETGGVRIEVSRDEARSSAALQSVHFRVIDSGIGISADAIDTLFDEFSQADSSTTRRFGGTGLGLSISRQLVELMGGEITVESQLGVGTTFHIRLPLPVSHEAIDETPDTFDLRTASAPLRILVAEDNPSNQLLIDTLLEKVGHAVDVVGNGLEAVAAVQSVPYDLVLMDVQMPEMDGVEATQQIRALGGDVSRIPIIAFTAEVSGGVRKHLLEAGMDDYLTKPVDRKKLARALHHWGHPFDDDAPRAEPSTPNVPRALSAATPDFSVVSATVPNTSATEPPAETSVEASVEISAERPQRHSQRHPQKRHRKRRRKPRPIPRPKPRASTKTPSKS